MQIKDKDIPKMGSVDAMFERLLEWELVIFFSLKPDAKKIMYVYNGMIEDIFGERKF